MSHLNKEIKTSQDVLNDLYKTTKLRIKQELKTEKKHLAISWWFIGIGGVLVYFSPRDAWLIRNIAAFLLTMGLIVAFRTEHRIGLLKGYDLGYNDCEKKRGYSFPLHLQDKDYEIED